LVINLLSIVGNGKIKLEWSCLASFSMHHSTHNDWKCSIPTNKSIVWHMCKGEKMLPCRYFFVFSTRQSWHTPSLCPNSFTCIATFMLSLILLLLQLLYLSCICLSFLFAFFKSRRNFSACFWVSSSFKLN
jgi:hypothetical protein